MSPKTAGLTQKGDEKKNMPNMYKNRYCFAAKFAANVSFSGA